MRPAPWRYRIKLKHLFTEASDRTSIKRSMLAIAQVLDRKDYFDGFDKGKFKRMPSDKVLGAADSSLREYCTKQLNLLYDYADRNRIWIE